MKPVRLQLSRKKGFSLQALSRATNGLEAVNVAWPSPWGNPYRLDDIYSAWSNLPWGSRERAQSCVDHYRRMALEGFVTIPYTRLTAEERGRGDGLQSFGAHSVPEVARKYLGGRNLACWCDLDQLCHADILLELANPEAP